MPLPLGRAQHIGPYEILETIGEGAMGEVYLARDSRLSRNVAIKTISKSGESDPARRSRFLQEARAASALNHPNIVTIHDFGTDNGISYIVTELVDGESLRKLIERGPLNMRQLLDVSVQIADALAAAHEAGIVHRDLKPENIMLTQSGRVKLLDFGLAKPLMGNDAERTVDELRTEPGLLVGTVAYMSPEQARGIGASFQSDQFSFGVILHEMATGNHPLRRETPMETLIAIANFSRIPFTPGPVAFRLLVERCTSKEPAKRFTNTAEIRERLVKIRRELPEASQPKSAKTQWWRSLPPRILTAALAAVLLLSLAIFAVSRIQSARPVSVPLSYAFVPFSMDHAVEMFPAWAPHDRVIAYSADLDGVLQIFTRNLKSGLATRVTRSEADCLFSFWNRDGSRLYYIARRGAIPALWTVNAAGGSPELVYEDVASAALSHDGKQLAMMRSGGSGEMWSLWISTNGGQPQRYAHAPFDREAFLTGAYLGFAPDDSKLAVWVSRGNGHSGFWILPTNGGAPVHGFQQLDTNSLARSFSWMPDSRRILFSERNVLLANDHLWIGDTRTNTVQRATSGTGHEQFPSVSSSGAAAALAALDAHYQLRQIAAGRSPGSTAGIGKLSELSPAWSPVHPEYAYAAEREGIPEIRLRNAESGWERVLAGSNDFSGHTAFLLDIAFAPNGQSIAYRRGSDGNEAIWISTLSGEPPVRLSHGEGFQRGPTWSPDGNWIAYFTVQNGKFDLMKAHVGSNSKPVLVRESAGTFPSWSPRGDQIATLRPDSGVNIISADGKQTRQVGSGEWLAVTWTPDGSRLVGLSCTAERHLEMISLDPVTGVEQTDADLGAVPAAFAYARAIGVRPIRGFSLAPDGHTAIFSSLDLTSGLWLLKGLR